MPKRKDTQVPQPSDPSDNVADEAVYKELGDGPTCQETIGDTIAQTRFENVSKLSNDSLLAIGKDASKQRRINAIDADEDIILVNVQDDTDEEMYDVGTVTGDEVFAELDVAAKDVNLTIDEVALAQALIALKSVKPKVKGDVIEEPNVPVNAASALTKDGKNPNPMGKSKTQSFWGGAGHAYRVTEWVLGDKRESSTRSDEEEAKRFTSEAKIEADHELAQRLQAEEQEELFVEEKAKLFQQLLEQRRKHFAAKSAEEKRNKPPTQAQQRKIMCTYLKNMKGKKLKDLKNKSFDSIQKMFDKAFKRVNIFVDFRIDLVEGSSKRAGEELEARE
ncbi:hypothetical protein Tco_0551685 [Tanacetum coccineum]